ncbi:MAG: response regulator [Gemmatimonadaceae bacterium]|nr:response regulator [Gemmatimonadaceae bacterium]
MSEDALAVRLRSIFTDELDEQIQELNDHLLALERMPADSDRLRAVFRVMHTLKGASRAAGLSLVEEVCHALESELSRARDGGSALGGEQIAMLFAAVDALGTTRDSLRADKPLPDAALTALLQHVRGRGSAIPLVSASKIPENESLPAPAPSSAPVVHERSEDQTQSGARVKIDTRQVDVITGAAGEIAGLAAILGDRAEDLASLRTLHRSRRRGGTQDDDWDQRLTGLLRNASADARALAAVAGRLGGSARRLRQRPFSELTETFPRVARDVARENGKQIRLTVTGGEIEADRAVLEALREPLLHLVRNAVDHGIELPAEREAKGKDAEGEVRIEGSLRGDRLQVTVSDDGHGLDVAAVRRGLQQRGRPLPTSEQDLFRTIFEEGFSTKDTATTLSGRGVGMGIVQAAVERMGGTVEVSSVAGRGTRISIDVPVSVATMRVVLAEVDGIVLGVPSSFVMRVARTNPRSLKRVDGRTMLVTGDRPIPVMTLASLLGPPFKEVTSPAMLQLVVLETGDRRLAVVVDDLIDERELVLRPLEYAGPAATNAIVGTALLGTGVVLLVLSVPALLARIEGGVSSTSRALSGVSEESLAPSRVLVVDDSITSRTLEQSVLSAAGYDVTTAVDGSEAWRTIERQDFALVVSDVEMPHLDGFGLCERIRANARTALMPVILVTSLDEPAQRSRGLEAGADAYITKSSFDQDTLIETVRMLIGRNTRSVE